VPADPSSDLSSRDRAAWRRSRGLAALALAACVSACGSDSAQPPSGGGPGPAPPRGISRLSWSQAASSLATAQGYRFLLFVDGARNALDNVTCAGGSSPFECSTPLPSLTSGRHLLELSALDPATGAESGRSAPLTVGQQVSAVVLGERQKPSGNPEIRLPSVTCIQGVASQCLMVTVAATGLAPVRRLVTLPDGRLLVLHENGQITFLPSGASEQPEFRRTAADAPVEIADVARDPEFATNKVLYFATVTTERTGQRRIDVFRVREVADRVGEAAMIISVPTAPAGYPALSAGLDGKVYLAMPSTPGSSSGERPYDGRVLRFTRDGAAAGDERTGSPILAEGSSRPVSLAWDADSRLLIASEDRQTSRLVVVALSPYSNSRIWPIAASPVGNADGPGLEAGLRSLAVARPWPGQTGDATVSLIGADPHALYLATLASGTPFELTSLHSVPLGSFSPTAAAFADTGDLFVAGSLETDAPAASVLQLRAR
jgi:hypothetical protein